ncbi:MAG: phage tail protein [Saprospiraceae bacterium]|nr:phage tail protein [Saprospiraceae bacterium]
MAQPYVGEIRMFAGNFAPAGWMFCEGQLLPISENETLFNLIGTTYGGDGQSTFGLPDLRGRIPLHQGNGYILAETGGAETVTLTVNQIPSHNHTWGVTTANASSRNPQNSRYASLLNADLYDDSGINLNPMQNNLVAATGGSQPHENRMPFLCINFIISLFGIFPSPS